MSNLYFPKILHLKLSKKINNKLIFNIFFTNSFFYKIFKISLLKNLVNVKFLKINFKIIYHKQFIFPKLLIPTQSKSSLLKITILSNFKIFFNKKTYQYHLYSQKLKFNFTMSSLSLLQNNF